MNKWWKPVNSGVGGVESQPTKLPGDVELLLSFLLVLKHGKSRAGQHSERAREFAASYLNADLSIDELNSIIAQEVSDQELLNAVNRSLILEAEFNNTPPEDIAKRNKLSSELASLERMILKIYNDSAKVAAAKAVLDHKKSPKRKS